MLRERQVVELVGVVRLAEGVTVSERDGRLRVGVEAVLRHRVPVLRARCKRETDEAAR